MNVVLLRHNPVDPPLFFAPLHIMRILLSPYPWQCERTLTKASRTIVINTVVTTSTLRATNPRTQNNHRTHNALLRHSATMAWLLARQVPFDLETMLILCTVLLWPARMAHPSLSRPKQTAYLCFISRLARLAWPIRRSRQVPPHRN